MPAPPGRGRGGKILQKASNQTRVYYAGWKESDEKLEKKNDLYDRAINSLVFNVKKRRVAENKPPKIQEVVKEVVKEVPVEVIKEVEKEVIKEVEKEVIKEVPVEIIKEVPFEVEVEVEREVVRLVPFEVEVEVEKEVVKKVEVPVEVIREVEVIKEVAVPVDNPETIKKLKDEFSDRLNLEKLSKKALKKRYEAGILQARISGEREYARKHKKLVASNIYIFTLFSLPLILKWILL